MEDKKSRKVYEAEEINNYKELLERVENKFPNNIAYKFKKDPTSKTPEYIEITYKKFIEDIKALSTGLLDQNLEGKKIVLIGNNRYEWCTSYLATTTSNMMVVPLDKALPENEIETLIERSEAEAVIFDKKYTEIMLKIKKENNNIKTLICMDDKNHKEIKNIVKF